MNSGKQGPHLSSVSAGETLGETESQRGRPSVTQDSAGTPARSVLTLEDRKDWDKHEGLLWRMGVRVPTIRWRLGELQG